MKAYLDAKSESAKVTISNLPMRLEAWSRKRWGNAKHTIRTTDWLLTIADAIRWGVKHSILGFLLGMGFLGLLTEVALWDALKNRELPNEPVPVDIVYGFLSNFFHTNAAFGVMGIVLCLVMNLHKLRLCRVPTLEHFMTENSDPEAARIVREAIERLNLKHPI